MAISPPPYNDINGIYVQIDKHIDTGLFSTSGLTPPTVNSTIYDGNARPGQLVVDTNDYNLYVGNETGNVTLVGPSLTQTTVDNDTITLGFSNQNQQLLLVNNSRVLVPLNDNVALPIGYAITLVVGDASTGYVSVADNGVLVYVSGQTVAPIGDSGTSDYAMLPQYSMYALLKVGTDTWILSGPGITESYC
jgi:hypothetical protein